jgi:transposase-like protein
MEGGGMTLPNCPFCEESENVRAQRVEPRGVKVCICVSCCKQLRVNAEGQIIQVLDGLPDAVKGQHESDRTAVAR